ncbi:MAG: radical SAM protein [Methanomicrobiales archaeon]|nr:radical SAM protein [Methanomicrobiales archaeon]
MKVIEIFKSLQGEGREQGKICTFIRLAGCNLRCAWCDTSYAWEGGTELRDREILAAVEREGSRLICITGGEPLLQAEEVARLAQTLHVRGYSVGIETNGTIDFRSIQPYAAVCMDVKCPSSGETSNLELLSCITEKDDVKFVVKDNRDLAYMEEVLARHTVPGETIVTPVQGSNVQQIAGYVLDHDLPVRFQVQLHKIIGVR